MGDRPTVQVRCHSGYTYAERPVSFVLAEREYHIREVLRTWREPAKIFFSVATEEGLTCTLQYDEAGDVWRLTDGG